MKLTIYLPEDMRDLLFRLPPRSVSRICQDAIRTAASEGEDRRDEIIADALVED